MRVIETIWWRMFKACAVYSLCCTVQLPKAPKTLLRLRACKDYFLQGFIYSPHPTSNDAQLLLTAMEESRRRKKYGPGEEKFPTARPSQPKKEEKGETFFRQSHTWPGGKGEEEKRVGLSGEREGEGGEVGSALFEWKEEYSSPLSPRQRRKKHGRGR